MPYLIFLHGHITGLRVDRILQKMIGTSMIETFKLNSKIKSEKVLHPEEIVMMLIYWEATL